MISLIEKNNIAKQDNRHKKISNPRGSPPIVRNTASSRRYPASFHRPFIIPVFLPHAGCPHRCAFCNQAAINQVKQVSYSREKLNQRINQFLGYKGKERSPVQIAFFGGNFLGLQRDDITILLEEATQFVRAGKVDSIRFSTRPDTIDHRRLDRLNKYPVSTIELGVQSMDDRVLAMAKRGHTSLDTEKAVALLKERDYEIGLQMMVGLPGDDETKSVTTAHKIARLAPDFVRIYPTVVLEGSLLSKWYESGKYKPLPLESCVTLVKKLFLLFREYKIQITRMGLQVSGDLENKATILAGPYHPAFGHMVHSEIFLDMAIASLKSEKVFYDRMFIKVHPRSISKMRGLKNNNVKILENRFQIKSLEIVPDPSLMENRLTVSPGT